MCFVPRPHWLASSSSALESSTGTAAAGDGDPEDWREDPFISLRPFKRQLGWNHDDLYYLRLPNLRQDRLPDSLAESIYKDDFMETITGRHVNAPFAKSIHLLETVKDTDSHELEALKAKCAQLEEEKRELLRISGPEYSLIGLLCSSGYVLLVFVIGKGRFRLLSTSRRPKPGKDVLFVVEKARISRNDGSLMFIQQFVVTSRMEERVPVPFLKS
ncbi:unnamed protein product [Dibothriocephalus latus]|uniref:Uncharacterized protein n=1 Tax=Dibothriocephalus latus TaxID=60516 RepID=A0A3P7LHK6_DIBLA|nr:unnamed protein product [Dibothriocephalus latus]